MKKNVSLLKLCLKKDAHINRALFLVIVFAIMIGIFISAFFSSMQKTEENRRAQLYGGWHFAVYHADEQVQNRLANHAVIQCHGKMKLYGVVKQGGVELGNFGTVDFNTKSIGKISLSAGSFPKGEREIAIERNALEALGYTDPQIGEYINLTLQYCIGDVYCDISETFQLSGILENYSNLWKGPEKSLLSFITGDIPENYTPISMNAFCDVKKDFLDSVDELASIAGDNGIGVINDYTYIDMPQEQPHSANNSSKITSSLLHLILLSITAFVVFILLMDLLQKKGDDVELMRNLGATEDQLINLYAKSFFIIAVGALITGAIFGTIAAGAAYYIVPKLYHLDFVFYLPAHKIVLDLFLLSGTVAVSFLLSILPLSGKSYWESKTDHNFKLKKRKKQGNQKPMTVLRMQRVFNRAHRKEVLYTLTIVCCTCVALSGITFFAYEKYLDYLTLQNTYPMDYEFSGTDWKEQPLVHMPEADWLKIKNSYGVEKVQAFKFKEALSYRWNRTSHGKAKLMMPNQAGYQGECSFLGVSNSFSDLEVLSSSFSYSSIDPIKFQAGQSVLLYLPNRHTGNNKIFGFHTREANITKMPINDVQVGDKLVLKGLFGEFEVEVAGIINKEFSESVPGLSGQSAAIIGSYQLANRLYETSDNQTMEFVRVYGNSASNLNRLDEEMTNLSGDMHFRNLRIEKSDSAVQSYFCLLIVALIDLAILLSSLVVWRGGTAFPLHSVNGRIRCLYILGMKKSRLLFLQIYNTITFTLIGGCLAYFVICIINSLKYVILNYSLFLDESVYWLTIFKEGILHFFNVLPIKVYAVFFCLFLILNLLVTVIPFFREIHFFTKSNK